MKIAVTYEDGQIFQHFGHTQQFKVYEVVDGVITSTYLLDPGESGHGALVGVLFDNEIDVLICGGVGSGAQKSLIQAGIKLYGGISGDADAAAQALVEGTLECHPEANCDHHDEDGHDCASHSCGSTCGSSCH